jgi:peptidoglycan/xylan/chitin deacetylase (PgdA/CDA1 family)
VANPCQLVWQYKLSISFIAATLSFIASLSMSAARSVNPKLAIPSPNLNQQERSNSQSLQINGLIGDEKEIYEKMLTYLAEEETKRLTFSVPVEFQGKTIRSRVLNNNAKVIALTFDDGPSSQTTPQVLDILKRENIKATFFVVGKTVKNHPQLMKQIVAEGHAIGNHTWNHHYHQYNPSAAAHELETTATLIHQLTGVKTALFRPPAGILNNGLVSYAQQNKYAVIMWSADSKDWQSRRITVPKLINNALEDAKPGGIILLHDGGGDRSKTVQALPKLIAELKQRGYQFVTVPELLDMPD